MPLSNLVQAHQEAIKKIIASHKGRNPLDLGNYTGGRDARNTVNLFVEPLPAAGWKDLVAMETELSHLLDAKVVIYANAEAVPATVMAAASPI
ncbi:MAG: hypothetical protein JNJ51_05150 [Methylobacillus glycogenes]|nr:hypothetical protein [Methylobacillus glycogenes]